MTRFALCSSFILCAFAWWCCKDNATTAAQTVKNAADSLEFSFVVIGCNRLDKADTNASNPSTANVAQLNRTFADVAALTPRPDYFFFTGDMVLGYTSDSMKLKSELTAWKAIYDASPLATSGITMVAMPGNHEAQNISKVATAAAERQWLEVMSPFIVGSNGPAPGSALYAQDSLTSDQSRLTYSFDHRGTHFIIINTDPAGRDWLVPAHWIAADAAAAHAAGAKHIFALGHKPAYPYNYLTGGTDGLNNLGTWNRDQLWNALVTNHAEAMITAHNHIWRLLRPTGATWQVIAGNGGSPLESAALGKDQYYGYTLVEVYKSGKVVEKSYGRDIPSGGYTAACPSASFPSTVRDSTDISWQ